MPRKKLRRFAELEAFPNVIQGFDDTAPGRPHLCFANNNPITLEIGCGKGEYTIELARRFPQRNFIGIDKNGARIWCGAKIALDEGLKNVLFVRADVEGIEALLGGIAVSEIWITFPDPYPKNSKASKRLTSPRFLNLYRRIIEPGGTIHFKTDDDGLFVYTVESLRAEYCVIHKIAIDLNGFDDDENYDVVNLKTTYERKHLLAGRTIKYLRFGFGSSPEAILTAKAGIDNLSGRDM